MRQSSLCVAIFILGFAYLAAAGAEEKPFNQEEWQRGVDELLHPKPADPKLEATWTAKNLKATRCWKGFIERNATPTGNAKDLAERACQMCDRDVTASGVASYDADRIKTPLTATLDKSIKSFKEICRLSASIEAQNLIFDKHLEVEKAKTDALNVIYNEKIGTAMDCSLQAAKIYALVTSETADAVATASFEKCHDTWSEAADFASKLFPTLSEFDRWDALKKGWIDHGISAVVDQRARQKIGQPPPADAIAPHTKQGDTGI